MAASILVMSVQLGFDSPMLDPESNEKQALKVISYVYTAVFLLEVIV